MTNKLYRLALDQLSTIIVTDEKGIILDVNENFCRITQYTAAELIGQHRSIIEAAPFPDQVYADLRATIAAGQVWRGEIKNKAKDGSYFWLDTSIYPLKDDPNLLARFFCSCLDITAKKEAEAEITRQMQQTDRIIESNIDAFLMVDRDWQIIRVNKIFEGAVGLGREQLAGHNFLQAFIAETNAYEVLEELRQANQEQIPTHFEFYYAARATWFEANAYPTGAGLALTFRDISERKAAAEKIRQSEQQLHAIMQSTADCFFFVGPDMRVVSFNEQARCKAQYLYNRQLREGDDIRQYSFNGDARILTESFRQALQGETVQVERQVEVNDQINWYWMTYFPVYDEANRLIGVALNVSNITHLKYFETEIRRVNERFRLVAKATNDAIYDWNMETEEIQWNEAFHQLFGYQPEEVGTSLYWWAQGIHPDDQERTVASLKRAIESKHTHWTSKYRFRCRDGSYKLVYDRGYLIFSKTGLPSRMIGALQDLQRLKEHETRILQQNQQLREIAFAQSHEVRRPVANLLGLLQCLNKADLSPENREILHLLEQTGEELDAIIQKIVAKTYQTSS